VLSIPHEGKNEKIVTLRAKGLSSEEDLSEEQIRILMTTEPHARLNVLRNMIVARILERTRVMGIP